MKNQTKIPQVVIIGAGFGGLKAARNLADAPVHVTLVDRNNYHLFQPLLYQVATAGVAPEEIAYPVRAVFRRQRNLDFQLAQVRRVDLEHCKLVTDQGELGYDYLILAAGGRTNFFGMDSLERNAFDLKELGDAVAIRNHVLRLFERAALEPDDAARQAMLTFVVAGGGPTGVESAGALSELIRLVLSKDFPRLKVSQARVLLLEAADRLLPAMAAELSDETVRALREKGVDVRFGAAVASFDGQKITLQDGQAIPTRTLIWAAGVRAAALVETLGIPLARQGRAPVAPTLQLPDHPEVFVIGDAAYLEDRSGKALPMVAPVATQQADAATANLRALLTGKPLHAFRYRDPGSMATIGRNRAVAQIGPLKLRGFIAWAAWLFVHLMKIVGFRNRLAVLLNWAWDYLFYDRAVRLIGGPEFEPEKAALR
ncbi:NADH dehydrogenase, FAD-containing subunit [Longilinea arvoryzae]|uniref:NADH:ubiquinone reductase (non-electrogenic) n=1 Tax=Longilinea arvoryzae TaxID=360412 RepID=A0A0S7BEC8_9CHLR|nr:NAD(P)/FAD-dependent oxidoreductase [Longilinea arvoryzae]GAP13280.1 NADH dehydrogenase, FAD-containing subunit [Longilinea arvoryzae]